MHTIVLQFIQFLGGAATSSGVALNIECRCSVEPLWLPYCVLLAVSRTLKWGKEIKNVTPRCLGGHQLGEESSQQCHPCRPGDLKEGESIQMAAQTAPSRVPRRGKKLEWLCDPGHVEDPKAVEEI